MSTLLLLLAAGFLPPVVALAFLLAPATPLRARIPALSAALSSRLLDSPQEDGVEEVQQLVSHAQVRDAHLRLWRFGRPSGPTESAERGGGGEVSSKILRGKPTRCRVIPGRPARESLCRFTRIVHESEGHNSVRIP
jgi:hypothetical protein